MEHNSVLFVRTAQVAYLKTMINSIKDILYNTNIIITPTGIRIVNLNSVSSMIVNMDLQHTKFEKYVCKKDKIIINVDMTNFAKIMSLGDNSDTFSLYIENDDYEDGHVDYVTLQFDNVAVRQSSKYKLKLRDIETECFDLPEVTYSSVINIPSSDFSKIIRDLSALSADKVEIKSVGNEIIFRAIGGIIGNGEIRRQETKDGAEFMKKQDASIVVQGEYPIKNLLCFAKCSALCTTIEMHISNDMPLTVKYRVSNLGELYLYTLPANL